MTNSVLNSPVNRLARFHTKMKSVHFCLSFCMLLLNGDAIGNEQLCAQQTWRITLESVATESGDPSEDAVLWDGIANLGFWAGNDGLNLDNGYLSSARTDSVQFNLMGMDISDTGGAP